MADTAKGSAKGNGRSLTRREILAQIPAARERERNEAAEGKRAATAVYDRVRERIVVELTNGVSLAIPVAFVHGLEHASHSMRAALEITPSGSGIIWPDLGTDVSIPGMLEYLTDPSMIAQSLGRLGGQARSEAKAEAARANGAKGGRPKSRG